MNPERAAPPPRPRVLLIEDDDAFAGIVRWWLAGGDDGVELERRATLAEGLRRLAEGGVDLLLLDLVLPDGGGWDTFAAVSERFPRLPVVVLTGLAGEGLGIRAIQRGAQDYLVKGRADGETLRRAVRYAIERRGLLRREEDFFHDVNHELRAPLSVLRGALAALSAGGEPLDDERGELLRIADASARQLTALLDDLVEFARADMDKLAVELRPERLDELLRETIRAFSAAAAEKRIVLATELPSRLPLALADPVRTRQILHNLTANAIKFTPSGGRVVLSAGRWDEDPRFLRVSVCDTGPGVDARQAEKFFERGFQGGSERDRRPGLGIGLYVCRRLAALQGGRIWAETRGAGGAFCFTVPAAEKGSRTVVRPSCRPRGAPTQ
ncbi:MAG: hybrid sensor histidine kinase/response regulator [Elusimicrobia bacterium]|nr:hybrid sensor histidine kinase/response regulator [Elusimicrobiota bacterium]